MNPTMNLSKAHEINVLKNWANNLPNGYLHDYFTSPSILNTMETAIRQDVYPDLGALYQERVKADEELAKLQNEIRLKQAELKELEQRILTRERRLETIRAEA